MVQLQAQKKKLSSNEDMSQEDRNNYMTSEHHLIETFSYDKAHKAVSPSSHRDSAFQWQFDMIPEMVKPPGVTPEEGRA
jgi:hypothetical protein